MQGIADSLDLGLEVEEGRMKVEEEYDGADRALGEPNRIVGLGDVWFVMWREIVGLWVVWLERRKESVGMGDVRVERRRESVAVVLPVANRRSVG